MDSCETPWVKVNDNICLLLNSDVKQLSHARYLCNFHDSNVLFINDETEQMKIKGFNFMIDE